MRFSMISLGALMLATATPALAQEEPADDFTVTGSATVVSDYRFRGFSQTGEEPTIQGGFGLTHSSGLYVGTWGSGVSFANGTELDVYGGFSKEIVPGLTGDIGVTLYLYPGTTGTEIIEPYVSLSGTIGPVSTKVGLAWAPEGQGALGGFSAVYTYADASVMLPSTPIKLKAHIGYANSDSFLGGLDGEAVDYSFGAEVSWKALTAGISYVNTDETTIGGWKEAVGADGAVILSLGAAF